MDIIARRKEFTISNVGLKPRFTTNDDIRLGSVNEALNFFFFSTNTLKVYCHNSKVGGLGLDWWHILTWWWRRQWCWKRSAAWWFFTASYGNVRDQYHRINQSGRKIWYATDRTFPWTWRHFQHREKICFNDGTNCVVPIITLFTENARHDSFVIATSFIAMPTWKFGRLSSRISFNVSTWHKRNG